MFCFCIGEANAKDAKAQRREGFYVLQRSW